MRRVVLSLLLMVMCLPAAGQSGDPQRHFDYDKKAPLAVKEAGAEKRGNVTIHDISFAGPKGGRVPAFLVVPAGKGPLAAVIWGHWYWENSEFFNRKEFLEEAVALAPSGVISLLPEGAAALPGYKKVRTPLNEQQVSDLVQAVVDMRRGADLLLSRKDVAPARLAYVGHSYNATVGAILSGVDRRFKAFVLMAGGLSDEVDLQFDEVQQYRLKVGAERFDAFGAKYAWTDPGRYVGHASPAVVFMQFATQESFLTPERARLHAEVVSEPKRFGLYDAPHALNAAARRDRIAFLAEVLTLKPPSPEAIAKIPDLPQPPEPTR
jgi:dienelactone hydrolase